MHKYIILLLTIISWTVKGQNVGVGTLNPTNPLHIKPLTGSTDPLKVESIQPYLMNDTTLLVVDPSDGSIRYMPLDSLINHLDLSESDNIDSLILAIVNNSLDSFIITQTFIDSVSSIVYNYGDTLLSNSSFVDSSYAIFLQTLLSDTAIQNLILNLQTDVDSLYLVNTTLWLHEGSTVLSADLSFLVDSALNFVWLNLANEVLNNTQLISQLRDSINTDQQNLDSAILNGSLLSIHIENGNFTTVDLSSLQDADADSTNELQDIDSLKLNGNILEVFIENGDSASIDLSLFNDPGTDNQNLDSAKLSGTILELFIENGDSTSVDLVEINNDIDSLTLSGYDLSAHEGGVAYTQDLESIADSAVQKVLNDSLFTPGSVIFADAQGRFDENNPNFYWEDTNQAMYLGKRLNYSFPGIINSAKHLGAWDMHSLIINDTMNPDTSALLIARGGAGGIELTSLGGNHGFKLLSQISPYSDTYVGSVSSQAAAITLEARIGGWTIENGITPEVDIVNKDLFTIMNANAREFTIGADGNTRLHSYGSGNMEAQDLGLPQTEFLAQFSTNGTILEIHKDSLNDQDWTLDGDTMYSAIDSIVVIKNGNVGIGTTNPDVELDVFGSIQSRTSTNGDVTIIYEDGIDSYEPNNFDGYYLGHSYLYLQNLAPNNSIDGAGAADLGDSYLRIATAGSSASTNPSNLALETAITSDGETDKGSSIFLRSTGTSGTTVSGSAFNTNSALPLGNNSIIGALQIQTKSSGGIGWWPHGYTTVGNLNWYADEAHSATEMGTRFEIGVTEAGTTTLTKMIEGFSDLSLSFPTYGFGARERFDLGKTQSNYLLSLATDGTILELHKDSLEINDDDWTLDGDTMYSAFDSTVVIKNGNVGIGTTNPSNYLHIVADSLPLRVEGLDADPNLDTVLTVDTLGVVYKTRFSDLLTTEVGDVLFVSTTGNNAAAEVGNLNRTFRDPWAAADSIRAGFGNATSIYVFPGRYTIGGAGSGADRETNADINQYLLCADSISIYLSEGVILESLADSIRVILSPEGPTYFSLKGQGIIKTPAEIQGIRIIGSTAATNYSEFHLQLKKYQCGVGTTALNFSKTYFDVQDWEVQNRVGGIAWLNPSSAVGQIPYSFVNIRLENFTLTDLNGADEAPERGAIVWEQSIRKGQLSLDIENVNAITYGSNLFWGSNYTGASDFDTINMSIDVENMHVTNAGIYKGEYSSFAIDSNISTFVHGPRDSTILHTMVGPYPGNRADYLNINVEVENITGHMSAGANFHQGASGGLGTLEFQVNFDIGNMITYDDHPCIILDEGSTAGFTPEDGMMTIHVENAYAQTGPAILESRYRDFERVYISGKYRTAEAGMPVIQYVYDLDTQDPVILNNVYLINDGVTPPIA
ncbi:MAG: hypothetical protein MRY83_19060, partial [Flavobacteriales bacterium]|nr:hypothetical protein [Flavobacteriales bacterium]